MTVFDFEKGLNDKRGKLTPKEAFREVAEDMEGTKNIIIIQEKEDDVYVTYSEMGEDKTISLLELTKMNIVMEKLLKS